MSEERVVRPSVLLYLILGVLTGCLWDIVTALNRIAGLLEKMVPK